MIVILKTIMEKRKRSLTRYDFFDKTDFFNSQISNLDMELLCSKVSLYSTVNAWNTVEDGSASDGNVVFEFSNDPDTNQRTAYAN